MFLLFFSKYGIRKYGSVYAIFFCKTYALKDLKSNIELALCKFWISLSVQFFFLSKIFEFSTNFQNFDEDLFESSPIGIGN